MDFSDIPFNSALERFGHLLPVGTLMQLRVAVPSFQNVPLVEYQFQSITVKRSLTAFLSIMFEEIGDNGNIYTTEVESPEAVFNNGPVYCYRFILYCPEGVPAEAVRCCEMFLPAATPATLPFLKCGAHHVYFVLSDEDAPPQTPLPLKTVVDNLEPIVRILKISWDNLVAVADPNQPAPNQGAFPDTRVEISFPEFTNLIEWLQSNAGAVAYNRLCGKAVLMCRSHMITDDNEEEILRQAALPYCPHPPTGSANFGELLVATIRKSYNFYFKPAAPCPHCLAAQQNNGGFFWNFIVATFYDLLNWIISPLFPPF